MKLKDRITLKFKLFLALFVTGVFLLYYLNHGKNIYEAILKASSNFLIVAVFIVLFYFSERRRLHEGDITTEATRPGLPPTGDAHVMLSIFSMKKLIIIFISIILFYNVFFSHTLPYYLNYKKFNNKGYSGKPTTFMNSKTGEIVIVISRDGPMSFSSDNYYVGLYNKNKKIIDEFRFGYIPLAIVEWNDKEIVFQIDGSRCSNDVSYINGWIMKVSKLGPYECRFLYN